MLRVELSCQIFDKTRGCSQRRTSWPLGLREDEVKELLGIAGVWAQNTRKSDRIEGSTLWAVRSLPLLLTILQSWKRSKPWSKWLVQCFETDHDLEYEWSLRLVFAEPVVVVEPEAVVAENEVTQEVAQPEVDEVEVEAKRKNREAHAIVQAMFRRIHAPVDHLGKDFFIEDISEDETLPAVSSGPKDFSSDEINFLINNLGQEDVLW